MDTGRFDALTQALFAGSGGRRSLVRLLAGVALSGVAAHHPPDEQASAKASRRGKGGHDHGLDGRVQADKKHKGKHKHKNRDTPAPPKSCKPGFRLCSDGSCQADTPGVCCIDEEFCPGGGCRASNECCPGERKCSGTTTCVGPNECCPAEKRCGDGDCYPQDGCCPEETNCGGGLCLAPNECCPLKPVCGECEEAVCVNGDWDCRTTCQVDDAICCKGECLLPCRGAAIDPETCQCVCPPGSELLADGAICCQKARACGLVQDGNVWKHSFCCGDGKLCWGNSVCCPAEWNGQSVCHSDACPCFLCSDPPPGCLPT